MKAGFVKEPGKGSHRKFKHPAGPQVTLSGKLGADAKPYQEEQVREALEQCRKGDGGKGA